jgi:hypothetical protein
MREGKWRCRLRFQYPAVKAWEPEHHRWGVVSTINDVLVAEHLHSYFKGIPWDAHPMELIPVRGGYGDDYSEVCVCSTRRLLEPWHQSLEECAGIETTSMGRKSMAFAGSEK